MKGQEAYGCIIPKLQQIRICHDVQACEEGNPYKRIISVDYSRQTGEALDDGLYSRITKVPWNQVRCNQKDFIWVLLMLWNNTNPMTLKEFSAARSTDVWVVRDLESRRLNLVSAIRASLSERKSYMVAFNCSPCTICLFHIHIKPPFEWLGGERIKWASAE